MGDGEEDMLPTTPPRGAGRGGGGAAAAAAAPALLASPPAALFSAPFPARPFLALGATVDARDTNGEWLRAQVVEVDVARARVRVRFFFWSERWAAWFAAASRKAGMPGAGQ